MSQSFDGGVIGTLAKIALVYLVLAAFVVLLWNAS